MGSLFLFIGSFSIIAGVLLLVNVFVMLAEERKSQLGMLRAIGLTRRRLVGEFALEGTAYALLAGVFGLAVGWLIGRGVVGGRRRHLRPVEHQRQLRWTSRSGSPAPAWSTGSPAAS